MSTLINGYSIVKNNIVIFGPIDWNQQALQNYLYSMGIYVSLPLNPPNNIEQAYLKIDGGYGIYFTTFLTPDIELTEKYTDGKTTVVGTNTVSITANSIALTNSEIADKLDNIKNNLIVSLKNYKDSILNEGLSISINNSNYLLDVNFDAQNNLYRTISIMNDTDTVNWKLMNGWAEFTKEDLQTILKTSILYTQKCYDKEKNIQSIINNIEDLTEATNFNIANEWEK